MKQTAEEILKEYVSFEDVNQSEIVELLPLTIVDAMQEYANQCQEDMVDKKYTKEDMIDFAFDTYCYISGIMKVPFNQVSENGTHAEENFKEYVKNKQD